MIDIVVPVSGGKDSQACLKLAIEKYGNAHVCGLFNVGNETYLPHEFMTKYPKYLGKQGVLIRLPIIDWTTEDVFSYLAGEENPLYSQGFDRVGCFPCLAAGDAYKKSCFKHDITGQKHYKIVQELEKEIGKSVFNSNILANNSGCSLCEI